MKKTRSYGTFDEKDDDVELNIYEKKSDKPTTEQIFQNLKIFVDGAKKQKLQIDNISTEVANVDKKQFNANLKGYLKYLDQLIRIILIAEGKDNSAEYKKLLQDARDLYGEYKKYTQMRK